MAYIQTITNQYMGALAIYCHTGVNIWKDTDYIKTFPFLRSGKLLNHIAVSGLTIYHNTPGWLAVCPPCSERAESTSPKKKRPETLRSQKFWYVFLKQNYAQSKNYQKKCHKKKKNSSQNQASSAAMVARSSVKF